MSIHDDFKAKLRKNLKEYKPEEEAVKMSQKKYLSKEQVKEMVDKRRAGSKIKDLAKEYGISTATVSYHINKVDSLEILNKKNKKNPEKVNDNKKVVVEEQFTNELIVPDGKTLKIEITITVGS